MLQRAVDGGLRVVGRRVVGDDEIDARRRQLERDGSADSPAPSGYESLQATSWTANPVMNIIVSSQSPLVKTIPRSENGLL
jgi:hypothetical protein